MRPILKINKPLGVVSCSVAKAILRQSPISSPFICSDHNPSAISDLDGISQSFLLPFWYNEKLTNQILLIPCHFRNRYQAEALTQIQRFAVDTGCHLRGFTRFHGMIQQELTLSLTFPSLLLKVRNRKLSKR